MLKDRVALVTGASRGIGAATARLLAANHAAVAINFSQRAEVAEEVVRQICGAGGRALAVQADVRVQSDVTQMVRTIEQQLGPIDTLVLNANIQFPIKTFMGLKWDEFEAKLNGELKAAFYCCHAVLPAMLKRKKGCIIAVSSGLSRQPGVGFLAHSTAKSALNAFVRCLALELGPEGIRVNCVAPGLTMTDSTADIPDHMKQVVAFSTPLRRIGLPEDVAGAILLLASDQAGFITGNYVSVDGGAQMA